MTGGRVRNASTVDARYGRGAYQTRENVRELSSLVFEDVRSQRESEAVDCVVCESDVVELVRILVLQLLQELIDIGDVLSVCLPSDVEQLCKGKQTGLER